MDEPGVVTVFVTVFGGPFVSYTVGSKGANGPALSWTSVRHTLWGLGLPLRPEKGLHSPAPFSPMFKLNKWEPKKVSLKPVSSQVVCPREHGQL